MEDSRGRSRHILISKLPGGRPTPRCPETFLSQGSGDGPVGNERGSQWDLACQQTEWHDVEAAVSYAVGQDARQIVLFVWPPVRLQSKGGQVCKGRYSCSRGRGAEPLPGHHGADVVPIPALSAAGRCSPPGPAGHGTAQRHSEQSSAWLAKQTWTDRSARTAFGIRSRRSPWTTAWPCTICRPAWGRRIRGQGAGNVRDGLAELIDHAL